MLTPPTTEYYGKKAPSEYQRNRIMDLLSQCERDQLSIYGNIKNSLEGSSYGSKIVGQASFCGELR